MNDRAPPENSYSSLREIVRRFGTPTYAYDLARIRVQMDRLRANLAPAVDVLYSLKANPSLGLSAYIARHGFGADVASAGELVTARAAGFPQRSTFLTGPDKSPRVLDRLRELPDLVVSLDSMSELELLTHRGLPQRMILRLRPDFCSFATCATGPDSRFGLRVEDLPRCREFLRSHSARVVGFHVFAGSQVLETNALVHHLRGGVELSLRAADALAVVPQIIDLGGGLGIPYGPGDQEVELAALGEELAALSDRVAPAKVVMELGRYFVAQAGWYLTTVIARQNHGGRPAVVVDGGVHQRGDLCGLNLRRKGFPPAALRNGRHAEAPPNPLVPTDILGCLSLPSDVMMEAAPLPALQVGDVLAFPNAGAYGLAASPQQFHAHASPAEVAFDGEQLHLLRERPAVEAILDGQRGGPHAPRDGEQPMTPLHPNVRVY